MKKKNVYYNNTIKTVTSEMKPRVARSFKVVFLLDNFNN